MELMKAVMKSTYIRCFFFGPGLPRTFGVPSTAAALLLVPAAPAFGPGRFLPFPSTAGGASRPLSTPLAGVAASLGVSTGVGSTTWAGVSGDDEVEDEGLEACGDFDGESWGNLARVSGASWNLTTMVLGLVEDDIWAAMQSDGRGGSSHTSWRWWWCDGDGGGGRG